MSVDRGQERKVEFLGGASVDGAPVAYVIVLAAVVLALSFIPFSVVVAAGGSFPMAQGILPLVGWILGPIAGAIANVVGTALAIFLAPHTASIPVMNIVGAIVAGLAAGSMVTDGPRKRWWIPISIVLVISWLLYVGRGILVNGVGLWPAFAQSFIDWSGTLLFILPTRVLVGKWLTSKNMGLVAAGLFLGTWIVAGAYHAVQSPIAYWVLNFPEEVWYILIPILPVEHLFRCLIGMVIGTGVIAGLRAIGLVKPKHAIY